MANDKIKIAWYGKHFGEEPPLVGAKEQGAGAIFFSGCNLKCVFCQNHQISQADLGKEHSIEEVSRIMLELQAQGAATIDLVSPTIWWRPLRQAIITARRRGLILPIVWNSNGYEPLGAIKQMSRLVDVYLPDFKYGDDAVAAKYSRAPQYARVAEAAVREMYRQVGRLETGGRTAKKGLIIRHLILPGQLGNTFSVLEKIAGLDKKIHLSLMSQYYPAYRAGEFSEIARPVSAEEMRAAEDKKFELGLNNGWTQEPGSGEIFLPDFTKTNPFV